MDWSSTFGVTSVHNFDISMFTPPTGAMEGWFVKADVISSLWGGEREEVVATKVLLSQEVTKSYMGEMVSSEDNILCCHA